MSISSKAVFTEPVYNSSATLDYLWEELTLPVPYHDDWRLAEAILKEEAERIRRRRAPRQAMEQMRRRYPVGRADVEPRVFVRATNNWVELSARFVVPSGSAHAAKDEKSRSVLERFQDLGLSVASATQEVSVRRLDDERESPGG